MPGKAGGLDPLEIVVTLKRWLVDLTMPITPHMWSSACENMGQHLVEPKQ